MKTLLLFLLYILFTTTTYTQSNYAEAMQQGYAAFKKGQYKTAINKYFKAEAFDPTKKETVKEKVNQAFDTIQHLQQRAELAEKQLKIAYEKLQIEQQNTQTALDGVNEVNKRNRKILDIFYFYNDRFALANKLGKCFFINKKGDKVEELGEWVDAEQFGYNGFAKVKKMEGNHLITELLDTFGNTSRIVKTVEELLEDTSRFYTPKYVNVYGMGIPCPPYCYDDDVYYSGNKKLPTTTIKILQLRGPSDKLNSRQLFSSEINKIKKLKSLELSEFDSVPLLPDIGLLQDLEELKLSYNHYSYLPAEIGSLKKLKTLNLAGNLFSALPGQVFALTLLTELDISSNKLESLPLQIGNLTNLKTLTINSNTISFLPKEMGLLKNLIRLSLNNNQLSFLPKEISQLISLEVLQLDNNQFKTIPAWISGLKNLKTLYLRGNSVADAEKIVIRRMLPKCRILF